MNTDDFKIRKEMRNASFEKSITSAMPKCKDIKQYAASQHAKYDKKTNQILYGIDTNMKVLGVSDGTCDQKNVMLKLNRYKCGLGTAGGNPCYPSNQKYYLKTNNIETFDNIMNSKYKQEIIIIVIILVFILLVVYN